jgi:hypothetical protein
MRPQQQGRRQRNRNSGGGNRRNQNPLSRNYESNGPDVKIRGNAQVIADKYATLARDALSSGDNVMAGELSATRRTLQPHHHGGAGPDAGAA